MKFLKRIISVLVPDRKVEVLYGYPPGSRTWLTVYHKRKSDRWVFEEDGLFADKRKDSWGPVGKSLMFKDKSGGVTKEEFDKAKELLTMWLKERGLI